MTVKVEGKNLVITMPFSEKGTQSGSGKSMVHASTSGNKDAGIKVNGKNLIIGINAYTKKED